LKLPPNISRTFALSALALLLASCSSFKRDHAPPSLGHSAWTSYDGKQMPWKEWKVPAGTETKAVVITIHGLSGAASDFWQLGERLPPQGIAVYGYELRGQGNDPEVASRGDIDSASQWLRDLLTFHRLVRARYPKTPIVWYGESLGSLIALHTAAKDRRGTPDALILASPVAGLRQHLSEVERWLLLGASRALPTMRVKLGDLAGVDESKMRVTSTSTHGEQMKKTPHHVESFTLRTLREIDGLLHENARAAHRIDVPVLIIASPHDIVSTPDQVQQLFEEIRTDDKLMHWYSRSYHLLLHDVQREQVIGDVTRWIRKRTL
jgi:alpha-beta hydrolase superfamily lysophospholipase